MSPPELKQGHKYICRPIKHPSEPRCTLVVENGEIKARFVSFDGKISFDDRPVFLQTEELWIASLHRNYASDGRRWMGESTVHTTDLYSNLMLVGQDAWRTGDGVKSACFRMPGVESLFKTSDRYKKIMDGKAFEIDTFDIHVTQTPWFNVRLTFAVTRDGYYENVSEAVPEIELIFKEGVALSEMLRAVTCTERFFSCLSGRLLLQIAFPSQDTHRKNISISCKEVNSSLITVSTDTMEKTNLSPKRLNSTRPLSI